MFYCCCCTVSSIGNQTGSVLRVHLLELLFAKLYISDMIFVNPRFHSILFPLACFFSRRLCSRRHSVSRHSINGVAVSPVSPCMTSVCVDCLVQPIIVPVSSVSRALTELHIQVGKFYQHTPICFWLAACTPTAQQNTQAHVPWLSTLSTYQLGDWKGLCLMGGHFRHHNPLRHPQSSDIFHQICSTHLDVL